MIRTTDLSYAAILIATGLARMTNALPPEPPERMITFELAVSEQNRERALGLEQGYNDLPLAIYHGEQGNVHITLGDFLNAIQRVRRTMRGVQAVRR